MRQNSSHASSSLRFIRDRRLHRVFTGGVGSSGMTENIHTARWPETKPFGNVCPGVVFRAAAFPSDNPSGVVGVENGLSLGDVFRH